MNFAAVKDITIPEGKVRRLFADGAVLWRKLVETDILALATYNHFIQRNGTISGTDTNWISSPRIPVTEDAVVRFALISHGAVGSVIAYDVNGAVLGYAGDDGGGLYEGVYPVPEGTVSITITGGTTAYKPAAADQYAVLYDLPAWNVTHYKQAGLLMWCDGIDNTGQGHDETVTTWKDLTGNGNDLINVSYKGSTTPAATVCGQWTGDGMTVVSANAQYLRTAADFDLGVDRTLEIRVTPVASAYSTIGFLTADRIKLREAGGNWWARLSESDGNEDAVNLQSNLKTIYGTPITISITRNYDSAANTTGYALYADGVGLNTIQLEGVHRAGERSTLLFGNENDNVTIHSVRIYDHALSEDEVQRNYLYDQKRFA